MSGEGELSGGADATPDDVLRAPSLPEGRLTWVPDSGDVRLELYRNVRDRDLAGREKTFMAEGRVVLEALLSRGRHPLRSLMVSRRRVPALLPVLVQVPPAVPIYVTPHEVMLEVAGFNIHRGLLALGERGAAASMSVDGLLSSLEGERQTVLALEGLTDVDNVGACFRNAAALGADVVLLDGRCCDPLYRKAIRVSAGHALGVPWARGGVGAGWVREMQASGFCVAALCLSERAQPLIPGRRPSERLALVLGTEGSGLSEETLEAADVHLSIPMTPGVDSLNVAVAGAIALYSVRG